MDIQLERIQDLEDRLNVTFENISVKTDEYGNFSLFTEIHTTNGSELSQNIRIDSVLYNSEGSIIAKEDKLLFADEFYGFEVLEFKYFEEGIADAIAKIKLYPKKG